MIKTKFNYKYLKIPKYRNKYYQKYKNNKNPKGNQLLSL